MKGTISVCVVLLLVFWTFTGRAQVTTGTISGTVSDSTGAVMPGAKIVIQNEDTGALRTVSADAAGHYAAPSLGLGNYRVTASMEGFQTEVRRGIGLTVGREAVVNLQLSVGAVTQTVEVTAEAPLVQTTEATVSYLVGAQTVNDLPLNGRDISQLILLNPGVSQAMNGSTVSAFGGFGKKISIGGRRDEDNSYLLDGSYIGDLNHNIPAGPSGALLGVATIREFQVLTNSYGAQYGRTLGGVFNAVSKSGTNEWHGELFEYLRNGALDARNFFDRKALPDDPRLPPFRRNQFGATLGGPIQKDKTFFFVAYEGMREALSSTVFTTVPDENARRGILPTGTVTVSDKIKPYLPFFPLPSPNGQRYDNGTAQFIFHYTQPTQDDFGQARIDRQISANDSLFGRFTGSRSSQIISVGFPGFEQLNSLASRLLTLSETHIFSPILLNTVRVSINRIVPVDQGIFPEADPSLSSVPGQPLPQLFPGSGLTGLAGYERTTDYWTTNRFTYQDDVNLTLRGHSLQFGGMVERFQLNLANPDRPFGTWTFASLTTFLQGNPRQYRGTPPQMANWERGYRQMFFALYLQDDWRVTPRLTLNLGLRWEPYTVANEVNGKLRNMRDLRDGRDTEGNPWWLNQSWKDFGPRFGFAWSPFASGRTSVRGGFGITYMPIDSHIYRNQNTRNSLQPNFQVPITVSYFPDALAQIAAIQATSAGANQVLNYSNLISPRVLQYNLNVQHQLSANDMLMVGFTGSRGINMTSTSLPSAPPASFNGVSLEVPAGATVLYPPYQNITYYTTNANSWYNGLGASYQHRFAAGLQTQLAYTYSKGLAESESAVASNYSGSGAGTVRYAHDMRVNKGPTGFNVGQRLSVNYSYDLPLGRNRTGLAGHLLSGWQWTGILTRQSGQPMTISGGATGSQLNALSYTQSPNVVAGFQGAIQGGPDQYFNPQAFYLPARPLELGNVGVNTLLGPGMFQWDMGLRKNTSLTERWKLQFRADFFNWLNHANFALPARSIFSNDGTRQPTAGQITRTVTSSRQVQLSLNLQF